jgi:D-sedoheptulose 7-phosphate isomerase
MVTKSRKEMLTAHFEKYRSQLNRLLDAIDLNILEKIVERIIQAYRDENMIYIVGNGGSASTASHMQVDFGFFVRYFKEHRLKVRSLTDNMAFVTAIGNDISYEDIFIEQMKDNFQEGDILIGISASGNSMNVVNAAEFANRRGGTSIGFVGFDGGNLKQVSTLCIHTPNPKGEYGPVEDLHLILDHLIVTYLEKDEAFMALHSG